MVTLLGKEFSSPKWCFKCKLHPKVWLEHGHKIGEDWTINALRIVSESVSTSYVQLGLKKLPFGSLSKLTNTFVLFCTIILIWVTIFYVIYFIMEMNILKIL